MLSGGPIRSGRVMCCPPSVTPLIAPESLVRAATPMLGGCGTHPAARPTNGGRSNEEFETTAAGSIQGVTLGRG